MEEKSNSDVIDDDFSFPEIENNPPISDIRSFLFNSFYPSDMAKHYLLLNEVSYSHLQSSNFYDIAQNNSDKFIYPNIFDDKWIKSFVESTLISPKKKLTNSLLKSIYFYFFDVIASQENKELNDQLELFLELTQNVDNPVNELLHCRIISMILLQDFKIAFDPNEIHKISEFDSRNLNMILQCNRNRTPGYSSISLIHFAIIYCIPSAVVSEEITDYDKNREIPNLIQVLPEPEFIFYHIKYFSDDIFEFNTFLFQSIYGFVKNEISTFEEKNIDDKNGNFGIINDVSNDQVFVNNPQLKIKSLLDLFLNNSIITGTFLRIILMFSMNQEYENSIINKISKILFQCPKVRLSILLRCQHLLSFFELYSKYIDTVFNPTNGIFFANIPNKLSKFSLYQAISPYWKPQNSIIQIFDCNNPTLLIPHAIAMINRCYFEPPAFLAGLSEMDNIQISGTLSQIFDLLVLCDNFSSKQTEEILFMGIANFFQMSRKNSQLIHENHFLHHISVVTTFKSLQFIFKTPQFNIVTEYGLLQQHAYKVIYNFICENIDLYKEYVDTYNNINNFYQRATIIQALSPSLKSVMLYFQIFLRATNYQQFWLALKFMKSLTYSEEDIETLENLVFELKDPILTKNAILFMTELVLKKKKFGELLVQSENFSEFSSQITKSFETEYGEASLFLLYSLYAKDLIKPEHKIKIKYIQYFFDNILELHEELFQTLLDISVMICECNKLKRFPFKITHQKQVINDRPDSISKKNFIIFMYINYSEVIKRCAKPPTDYDIQIKNKKIFSFMNLINRPYYYLITPILFEGTELENAGEHFELIEHKVKNPSFLKEKEL